MDLRGSTLHELGLLRTAWVLMAAMLLVAALAPSASSLPAATEAASEEPSLLADINPGPGSSNPRQLIVVDSTVYFRASDGTTGRELWKSDGTEAGTALVKDIWPGPDSSDPLVGAAIGSTLYFTADDGTNGHELWKTDGTEGGTALVKDINSGPGSSSPSGVAVAGSTVYFKASDGTTGLELWKSDGTEAGTVLVKDINSGPGSSNPYELTVAGSTVYFRASDGTSGSELWKSDGTEAGTRQVKDIWPGGASRPSWLTVVGSTLYFTADDGTAGTDYPVDNYELWKSDGTEAGTVLVKDITPGLSLWPPSWLTAVGSTLYFMGYQVATGRELWKSDGTEEGTVLVKDIWPGPDFSGTSKERSSSHYGLTAVGSTLYLIASDGTTGYELWKSDGTEAGTVLVKDIWPGPAVSRVGISKAHQGLTAVGSNLYFAADDGTTGFELWKSDGTEAGTVLVKDIWPGPDPSHVWPFDPGNLAYLTVVGSTLYFAADDGTAGDELWVLETDSTLPVVTCSVAPSWLPAPNGEMRDITVSLQVVDEIDLAPTFTLLSVQGGDSSDDIRGWDIGTADTQGQLRAESNSAGRTYTLTYQASDHAGNVANCVATVEVSAALDGTMAEATSLDELVEATDYSPAVHGSVLRLYWAFFNREPEIGGARYWIDVNSQGYTLDQIAEFFTLSQEFANNYAGTTNQKYLEAVYSNVLGRYYDQAGFHYWLGLLESGQLNRGGVVRWIAANNEFIDKHPYLPKTWQ